MAVERRDPLAGRPLKGVPPLPSTPRPSPPGPPTRASAWTAGTRPRPPAPGVPGPSLLPLVLWPALLTLAVTLLRLVGELRGWSPEYFSRLPGGGLSPLGITWLAPLVGFYLGWRLERAGVRSPSPALAFGLPAAALLAGPLLAALAGRLFKTSWTSNFALWAVASVVVAAVTFAAWPALGRLLLAYAYAARIPVAIVMAVAVWKGWGTHYDLAPPGFPVLPRLRRWLWIGLLPQATIWVAWTVATGAILGALGHWVASRKPR
jgi:hypothetical protein